MIPSRHRPTPQIRARYGARVDRLAEMLMVGDPLADDAADALMATPRPQRDAWIDTALREGVDRVPEMPTGAIPLFRDVERVPFWFDRVRANQGGDAFVRSGMLGGLVLGMRSLIAGYCSPAGNKPLTFSGRMDQDTGRRLFETSRFVHVVTQRDGMVPGHDGFAATVKVRLMHAHIRRMLVRSDRWQTTAWGLPINQFDMAGTVLLFSLAVLDGVRSLGFHFTDDESEGLLHLWRYNGHVMGVTDELLCASENEAWQLWEMIMETQDPPDEDSRRLASALLESPVRLARTPSARARAARQARFAYGLSRYLIGDRYADHLHYPRTAWRFGLPAIRAVLSRADSIRRGVPGVDKLALHAGVRYWQRIVNPPTREAPVTFAMPDALRG